MIRHLIRAIRILVVLGLLGGMGWGGKRIASFSRRPVNNQISADLLDTVRVREGEFLITVAAVGRLQAHKTTTVMSPNIRAKVTFVAQDGAPVKQGDILFRFDDTEFRRDLREKELAFENANADTLKTQRDRDLELKNAQGQADKTKEELRILKDTNATQIRLAEAQFRFDEASRKRAEHEREQRKRQADERLIPRVQLELAEADLRTKQFAEDKSRKEWEAAKEKAAATEQQKQTDLDNAQFVAETASRKAGDEGGASLAKAQALKTQLDIARQQLDWCTLRAPSSGLLVLSRVWQMGEGPRPARVGDQLWPQMQLAEIPDLSRMQIVCKVPERDIGSVKPGQDVLVTLEEQPDKTYRGKVARVGSIAEEIPPDDVSNLEPGTRVFNVPIDLLDKDPKRMMPGMTASVEIITQRLAHTVYMRKDCVFDEGESHIVYVQRGRGFVAARVTPGAENVHFVQIKKGVHPGQHVATQRPIAPTEGGQ